MKSHTTPNLYPPKISFLRRDNDVLGTCWLAKKIKKECLDLPIKKASIILKVEKVFVKEYIHSEELWGVIKSFLCAKEF